MKLAGFTTRHDPEKTYLDPNGYYRFRDTDKPLHRWVVERDREYKLTRRERVHHIDHNKRNNTESNLYVCINQREHEKIHRKQNL